MGSHVSNSLWVSSLLHSFNQRSSAERLSCPRSEGPGQVMNETQSLLSWVELTPGHLQKVKALTKRESEERFYSSQGRERMPVAVSKGDGCLG